MRVRLKKSLEKWEASRNERVRPMTMTRKEWRSLGSIGRSQMRRPMFANIQLAPLDGSPYGNLSTMEVSA